MNRAKLTFLSLTVGVLISPLSAALADGAAVTAPVACKESALDALRAGSESQKLKWLETDSPERTAWIRAQNDAVNASLKKSENATYLADKIRTFLPAAGMENFILPTGEQLQLINQGLGKGTDLRLLKPDGSNELLFSSSQILKNLNAHILNFTVSADKNLVLLSYEKKGSLDNFHHLVYDLKQRKIITPELDSANQTPAWASASSFYTQEYNPTTNDFDSVEMDLTGKVIHNLGDAGVVDRSNSGSVFWSKADGFQFIMPDGSRVMIKDAQPNHVFGRFGSTVLFNSTNKGAQEIRAVDIAGTTASASRVLFSETERSVSGAALVGGAISFLSDSVDSRRIMLIDLKGQQLAQITLPDGVAGAASKWDPVGQMLTLNLQSDFAPSTQFVYDVGNNHFARNDVEKAMFRADGLTAKSQVIEVVGKDGVAIPVRLTYLEGTKMDGTAPAYIEVYGGFDLAGYFGPAFNPFNQLFIKNGGILVHPIVRGGNEFGEGWHKAAMLHHKARTFEDVIAVADALAQRQYSSPKKIVLTGTSNGGMVVAASALKSPKSFGLVIPISGVEDMLDKEYLDRRMGEGWKSEYGDSRLMADLKYLLTYAPVEKAAKTKNAPKILIINGRDDSRVNPAHSFKLQAALQSRVGAVNESNLLSLRNSGHWLTALSYNDLIAWRAQTVIWTSIYDHLGINLNPPAPSTAQTAQTQ